MEYEIIIEGRIICCDTWAEAHAVIKKSRAWHRGLIFKETDEGIVYYYEGKAAHPVIIMRSFRRWAENVSAKKTALCREFLGEVECKCARSADIYDDVEFNIINKETFEKLSKSICPCGCESLQWREIYTEKFIAGERFITDMGIDEIPSESFIRFQDDPLGGDWYESLYLGTMKSQDQENLDNWAEAQGGWIETNPDEDVFFVREAQKPKEDKKDKEENDMMKAIESYKQMTEKKSLFFTIVDETDGDERFYHFFTQNPIPYCEESKENLFERAFEGRKALKIFWLLRRKADKYSN